MKITKTIEKKGMDNREFNRLLNERTHIYRMLLSAESLAMLRENTRMLAINTGFDTVTVASIFNANWAREA